MDSGQKREIIDKIHSMRVRAFEKREDGEGNAKPYLQKGAVTGREKDQML